MDICIRNLGFSVRLSMFLPRKNVTNERQGWMSSGDSEWKRKVGHSGWSPRDINGGHEGENMRVLGGTEGDEEGK